MKKLDWKICLNDLFAATVNQQTIEEAVEMMVSVSADDEQYHQECISTLDAAIQSLRSGDNDAISCINKSGYQVSTVESALELLEDFKRVYMFEFSALRN